MPNPFNEPLKPIETMTAAEMEMELTSLRGDRSTRRAKATAKTKKQNKSDIYKEKIMVIKSAKRDHLPMLAEALGMTIKELEEIYDNPI